MIICHSHNNWTPNNEKANMTPNKTFLVPIRKTIKVVARNAEEAAEKVRDEDGFEIEDIDIENIEEEL